jgi:hypothetical protein
MHNLQKDTVKILRLSDRRSVHYHPQRLRGSLHLPEFKRHAEICRIPQDSTAGELGKDFLQKLEPFSAPQSRPI